MALTQENSTPKLAAWIAWLRQKIQLIDDRLAALEAGSGGGPGGGDPDAPKFTWEIWDFILRSIYATHGGYIVDSDGNNVSKNLIDYGTKKPNEAFFVLNNEYSAVPAAPLASLTLGKSSYSTDGWKQIKRVYEVYDNNGNSQKRPLSVVAGINGNETLGQTWAGFYGASGDMIASDFNSRIRYEFRKLREYADASFDEMSATLTTLSNRITALENK